jgi:hypothetical protein
VVGEVLIELVVEKSGVRGAGVADLSVGIGAG